MNKSLDLWYDWLIMTDKQFLDIFLKRAAIAGKSYNATLKNPRVVIVQQYGRKLYFAVKFDGAVIPFWIKFAKDGLSKVFSFPEILPEKLFKWKQETIHNYIDFDLKNTPKEVVHIFFSSLISALNIPGMSVGFQAEWCHDIFDANETYEEISIEADLMSFSKDF